MKFLFLHHLVGRNSTDDVRRVKALRNIRQQSTSPSSRENEVVHPLAWAQSLLYVYLCGYKPLTSPMLLRQLHSGSR
jgi:hypothetical protein